MSLFRNLAVAIGLVVLPSAVMAQANPPTLQGGARSIEKSTTVPTKPAVHTTKHVKSKRAKVKHVAHRIVHKRASTAPRPATTTPG